MTAKGKEKCDKQLAMACKFPEPGTNSDAFCKDFCAESKLCSKNGDL